MTQIFRNGKPNHDSVRSAFEGATATLHPDTFHNGKPNHDSVRQTFEGMTATLHPMPCTSNFRRNGFNSTSLHRYSITAPNHDSVHPTFEGVSSTVHLSTDIP